MDVFEHDFVQHRWGKLELSPRQKAVAIALMAVAIVVGVLVALFH